MFPVYACVSSLEGRDLCTCLYTYTNTHISQIKQQAASTLHQKKALFTVIAKFIYLYSYHLATLPFSWRFSFDKLSKCVKIVMYIQFGMLISYKILVILSIV